MKRKVVGRFAPLTVINRKDPTSNGVPEGDKPTMNGHPNPARRAKTTATRAALALACITLPLTATTAVLVGAGPAYAGSWIEVSCVNPSQSAAPSEGWTSFAAGGGYGSNNGTGCGPGSPMFALLSTDAGVAVGSVETLEYTPPSGSTLAGGSADVSMYADGYGYGASGTAVAYTPEYTYNSSNVLFQCASGLSPCANGTNDYSGVLGLPSNRGGTFYLSAGCGGESGRTCNEGGSNGAWSLVQLWWANFLLSNTATPAATGVGGTLLAANARGIEELAFTATDAGGPGVYETTAQVDGKTLYSGTPDTNSGACVPVGNSSGVLMFDYSQPCRQSESVDIPINTASLSDGQHTLKVTVEDAAQNSSVVYDGAITTDNAPANTAAPAIVAPSQVFVGTELSTQPGSWSAPTGAGSISYGYQWEDCDTQGNNCTPVTGAQSASYTPAPSDVGHTLRVLVNATDSDGLTSTSTAATGVVLSDQSSLGAPNGPGTTSSTSISISSSPTATASPSAGPTAGAGVANGTLASETAQIRLGVKRTISRSFSRSPLQVNGRLLNGQGQAIGNASLDIVQQTAGSSSSRVIGHATTQANGTFIAHVPAGASRQIDVAYCAFSGDASYAAQAKLEEYVNAAVQLNVTPRDTGPEGTILLTGKVLGPIPSQGVIVDLLVHYRGHWEPFRTPRTDAAGEFQVAYQFQGGIGRFPFRAETPAGQAGFPFVGGYSKAVDVTTG
jgi:hypothetical protein